MKKIIYLFMLMSAASTLTAAVKRLSKADNFDQEIRRSKLAIALFYREDKTTRKNKEVTRRLKELQENFKKVSSQERETEFVAVNLARGDIGQLGERYRIAVTPMLLLFKDGVTAPFTDESGKRAELSGFPSRQQMHTFIASHFQKYIAEIKKERREQARERAERRAWFYGPSFYAGWGYPGCYGYGCGWYPGLGWGYGWRSPYWW